MLKQKHFIDIHKGMTPIFIIFLISIYSQWTNLDAVIYLALHGTYGILWITKSFIYPDKQWENKTSIWYGLFIWIGLSIYWISPYIIVTGKHFMPILINNDILYLGFCISMFVFGVFLHFTSDMQKYAYLKLKPGNLITEEMFSRSRNANYLGELLIYLGFTLIAKDWLPLLGLMLFVFLIWIPNMIKKDKSLSRYPEFHEYSKKSKRFFPFLF